MQFRTTSMGRAALSAVAAALVVLVLVAVAVARTGEPVRAVVLGTCAGLAFGLVALVPMGGRQQRSCHPRPPSPQRERCPAPSTK